MSQDTPYGPVADTLYERTGSDWNIIVHHTLTEPVCCTVTLWSDDPKMPRIDGFIGTYDVNESIRLACGHLLKTLT